LFISTVRGARRWFRPSPSSNGRSPESAGSMLRSAPC
jgi:hypothetical protein